VTTYGTVILNKRSFAVLPNKQYKKCVGNAFTGLETHACVEATQICLRNVTTGARGSATGTGTNYLLTTDPATTGPCIPKPLCSEAGQFGFGPRGIYIINIVILK